MSAFPRPSFEDLIASAQADLTRLGNPAFLRRAMVTVLAYQQAALASGEYDYLDWMVDNVLLPDTATGVYLDRWANIVGLQREGAVAASGFATFSAPAGPSVSILTGTQLQAGSGANAVTVTATGTVGGNSGTLVVPVAAAPGSAGNLAVGTPLTMLVAQAGVNGTALVSTALTGGADGETDDALRVRVLQRLALPPQGGAAYDYVSWAETVPGVTRVWVYPLQTGPNSVTVIFTMDGRSNIIPLSGDIATVQAAINALRPVTAQPTVIAPTTSPVNVTVTNLMVASGFLLSTVEANISQGLAALFAAATPGGYGWDGTAEAFLTGGAVTLSQIYGAILNAAGVVSFDLTAPVADVTSGFGVMPVLGTVSLP